MNQRNLLLSVVFALVGCSASASSEAEKPARPNDVTPAANVEQARSDKPRETSPKVAPSDVEALTADARGFGMKMFAELRKGQDGKNLFFSPHSIHTAFGMLYAGARGTTETAMKSALGFSLPQDRLHAAMNALDLALESRAAAGGSGADGKGFRLTSANSVWAQKGYVFQTPYLDQLAVNYGAGLNLLDFARDADGAANTINGWIEQKTENRIQKLVQGLPPNTKMVLVNAVYFNAAWQQTFSESATQDGSFQTEGGAKPAKMMQATREMRFAKTSTFDAVALPYEGGNVELVAIAPAVGTYGTYESGFDRAAFDGVIAALQGGEVSLKMPRFEIAGDAVSLKGALKTLGAGEMFDEAKANFSGITPDENLYVFDAAHKAFVKVDEKGTEAAAATAIVAGTKAAPLEPVSIALDRPFLFAIRDVPTGAVLFMGRVVTPE